MSPMHRDIDRVLISQYQIMARIKDMADQITRDHTSPAATKSPSFPFSPAR